MDDFAEIRRACIYLHWALAAVMVRRGVGCLVSGAWDDESASSGP